MAYEYGKKGEELVYWDAKKQAIVAAWIDVEAHHFDPPATKLISDLVFHPTINGINTDENGVAEAEAKLARVLDVYEARLTDFKYLASNKFTLADLAHLPNLHYLLRTPRKKLIEERPHVNSWCNNIMARPAWGKVIQMKGNVESEGGPYSESSFTSKLDQTVEPTRKVYGCLNSVGTMSVLASLYEHEVDFEFVSINMDLGEHENKSFLAISPFGEVPAFQDGEWTLFESRAIMRFIFHGYMEGGKEHIYREPKLQGITSTWVDIEDHYFDPPASKLIQELVYKPSQNGFNKIERSTVAEEEAKLAKVLDIYEDRLGQYNYLGGNKFTSADLTHLPNLYYLMDTPVKRLFESQPHVNDWCNKIMTRPSWNQVVSMLKKATP